MNTPHERNRARLAYWRGVLTGVVAAFVLMPATIAVHGCATDQSTQTIQAMTGAEIALILLQIERDGVTPERIAALDSAALDLIHTLPVDRRPAAMQGYAVAKSIFNTQGEDVVDRAIAALQAWLAETRAQLRANVTPE